MDKRVRAESWTLGMIGKQEYCPYTIICRYQSKVLDVDVEDSFDYRIFIEAGEMYLDRLA